MRAVPAASAREQLQALVDAGFGILVAAESCSPIAVVDVAAVKMLLRIPADVAAEEVVLYDPVDFAEVANSPVLGHDWEPDPDLVPNNKHQFDPRAARTAVAAREYTRKKFGGRHGLVVVRRHRRSRTCVNPRVDVVAGGHQVGWWGMSAAVDWHTLAVHWNSVAVADKGPAAVARRGIPMAAGRRGRMSRRNTPLRLHRK